MGDLERLPSNAFSNSNFDQYKQLSPVEFLELYFDEEFFESLVSETKRYASYINQLAPQLKPGKKWPWDTKDDIHNKIVADSMRRDRFIQIMRVLHVQENNRSYRQNAEVETTHYSNKR